MSDADAQSHTFAGGDGTRLAYRVLGSPAAERTLICQPGGPGMSSDYFGDMAGLGSERLRVVLLDPRGTGESELPVSGSYELIEFARDLDALRTELGLERIDLLGHSHGGFVSMTYALEYPDGVGHMVLACSAARFGPELGAEAQAAYERHAGERWYAGAREAQRRRQAGEYDGVDEAMPLYREEVRLWFHAGGPRTDAFLERFARQRPNLDSLRYFNERIAPQYDMRPQLPEIAAPTLVINGVSDFFGPQIAAQDLGAIPGARVVVLEEAGHWAFAENPDAFRREVEAFLELE
jgi:proline iminopeptidase